MRLCPPVQRRTAVHTNRVSVTLDTLPPDVAYIPIEIAPGYWLIIVRDGITYGELVRAYVNTLPAWVRKRLFAAVGVPDAILDPDGCQRAIWWHPDWIVTLVSIHILERAVPGLITPWDHDWLAVA